MRKYRIYTFLSGNEIEHIQATMNDIYIFKNGKTIKVLFKVPAVKEFEGVLSVYKITRF